MSHDEELERYKKQFFEHELAIKRQQIKIETFIILFAVLTLGGFFILLYFLREATLTGLVVGQAEANIYGGIVFIVFLVVWGFLLFQWHLIHKDKE